MNTKQTPSFGRRSKPSSSFIRPVLMLAVILSLAGAARLPAGDLGFILSGKAVPLSFKLKDFGQDWRCVSIHGPVNVNGNISLNISGNTASSVAQNNNLLGADGGTRTYVTKGQVLSANEQEFLIAYHLPSAGLNLTMLLQMAASKQPPNLAPLAPDTELQLCLLNVKAISSLENVRVFDMQREIETSLKAAKAIADLLKQEENKKPAEKPANPPQPEAPVRERPVGLLLRNGTGEADVF